MCCGRYIHYLQSQWVKVQSITFEDSHYSQQISQKTKYLTRWIPNRHLLIFSITIFCLQFEDVLQIRLEDVLKMSWRNLARSLGRRKVVTLKTSQRHVLKVSWRRLGNKQNVYRGYLSNHGLLTNLNQYLTNLYLTNLYFTNVRRTQNALITTQ